MIRIPIYILTRLALHMLPSRIELGHPKVLRLRSSALQIGEHRASV